MSAPDKSKQAISLLKGAIVETIGLYPDGIGNSDVARRVQLEPDFEGSQKTIRPGQSSVF